MSYFAGYIFLVASLVLAAMAWVQSDRVSWATDKCGCIGTWGLFAASMLMLMCLSASSHVIDAAAAMILAFAVWMACRLWDVRHQHNGAFGRTDKSPLGKE
jgi:hypothetical protein